jgi:DtxR family Mn-dependent transcriptional regulator
MSPYDGRDPERSRPVSHHSVLIDTTQMYLRTIFELEEEGVVPLRARIVERLGQSGPTVSQTVARMERDGLLHVESDRRLALTGEGRRTATAVMRKHRLAERLLIDVLGLDWELVHIEACRWEHVMSDAVERRILALVKKPLVCPHGNPIPGLEDLGLPFATQDPGMPLMTLAAAADSAGADVVIQRISEQIQPDEELMRRFADVGLMPGQETRVVRTPMGCEVSTPKGRQDIDRLTADHVFVVRAPARQPPAP